ncbi:MAG: hypothetical protein FWC32_08250 [Firmicutes bacterium]|nr:hypothetical protein [Bacillota bacterium]
MDKNTGKTTVLNYLAETFNKYGIKLLLTGIGRDGEDCDIVTGTAKPRIFVQSGTTIITAEGLLGLCDITKEIVKVTDYHTAMGRVVVVVAKSDGFVQIGGPSALSQLDELLNEVDVCDNIKFIIDGAISRKSLARLGDAVVLCAGAGQNSDIKKVIAETSHAVKMLTLSMPPKDAKHICFEGAVSDKRLLELINSGTDLKGVYIVADDPGKIFIKPETYEKLLIKKGMLTVKTPVNLAAVTINPVSARGYAFDADEFLVKMSAALPVPVFNVKVLQR